VKVFNVKCAVNFAAGVQIVDHCFDVFYCGSLSVLCIVGDVCLMRNGSEEQESR